MLKPELHWDVVQLLCHRILVRGFLKLGIFRAEAEGLDVHDVPSASKPEPNPTIIRGDADIGHEKFYEYLRLRLPLQVGMVLVRLVYGCCLCCSAVCVESCC